MQESKYSVRLDLPDMFAPVQPTASPRRARANVRAASTICSAGTSALAAASAGGEVRDSLPQCIESTHVLADEGVIVEFLLNDDVNHGCQECSILSRTRLDVDVCPLSRFRGAGINRDQLHVALQGFS